MKGIVLDEIGSLARNRRFTIHEEPQPVAGVGERMMRVKAVGVCGSDLHWCCEGSIGDGKLEHLPVLGHEFAGVREVGERVVIDPAIPARTVNFVNMAIPINVRTWPLQSATDKMAQCANSWRGMRTASSLRKRFETTTSNHRR